MAWCSVKSKEQGQLYLYLQHLETSYGRFLPVLFTSLQSSPHSQTTIKNRCSRYSVVKLCDPRLLWWTCWI